MFDVSKQLKGTVDSQKLKVMTDMYNKFMSSGRTKEATLIYEQAKQQGIDLAVESPTMGLMEERYKELSDQKSPFYQAFEKSLRSKLSSYVSASTPTTSNLLAVGLASGLGYGSASSIASKQRESIEAKNRETVARTVESSVSNAYIQGSQMAGSALGMLGNAEAQANQLALQYKQLQAEIDAQPTFGEQLLSGALGIGSSLLGNYLGMGKSTGGFTSGLGMQSPTISRGTSLQGWIK